MLPTVLDFRAWTGFRKETCNRDANDIRVITGWRSGASIAGARTTGAGSRPTISRVANIPVDWCRSAVAFPRRCSIQQQTVHRLQDSGQNGQISHYRVWWRIGGLFTGYRCVRTTTSTMNPTDWFTNHFQIKIVLDFWNTTTTSLSSFYWLTTRNKMYAIMTKHSGC